MNSTDSDVRYVRAPGTVARRVAGEMLLVPTAPRTLDTLSRAAELFVLNETGEQMWDWLTAPSTIDELARKLIDGFEITEETARSDAAAFIQVMLEKGLATVAME